MNHINPQPEVGAMAGVPARVTPLSTRRPSHRPRLHRVQIPRLRCVGFAFTALILWAYGRVVAEEFELTRFLETIAVFAVYSVVSWWILYRFYGRRGELDLGLIFLGGDVFVLSVAVIYMGPSYAQLACLLVMVRVADQVSFGFRRAFGFLNFAILTYLLAVFLIRPHSPEQLKADLLWGAIAYVIGIYVSLTASTAERLRAAKTAAEARVKDLAERLDHKYRELHQKTGELVADLEAASQIQQSLLPQRRMDLESLKIAWRYLPRNSVGGDILDVVPLSEHRTAFYVADVVGHGVPSALITFSVAHSLSFKLGSAGSDPAKLQQRFQSPAYVLERLDRDFPIDRFDKFFTICYAVLDTRSGELRYSSAGHPPPVLIRANGEAELLKDGGPVIGMGSFVPFEEGRVFLSNGDRVFMYTDGITEIQVARDELFGSGRLRDLLVKSRHMPLHNLCDEIVRAVDRRGEAGISDDDRSILALEFNRDVKT